MRYVHTNYSLKKVVIAALCLYGCTKDIPVTVGYTNHVYIMTAVPHSVSYDSAVSGGDIQSNDGEDILERGVCWSDKDTPVITRDRYTSDGKGNGTYLSRLKSLVPNTTYFIRAYIRRRAGVMYGNMLTCRTIARTSPKVKLVMAVATGKSQGMASGLVTQNGGSSVFQSGVLLSQNGYPTVESRIINSSSDKISFQVIMDSLSAGVQYFVRAFAVNEVGMGLSDEIIAFRTLLPSPPTVLTHATYSGLSETSIVIGGSVKDDEGVVDERGICFGTSTSIDINGSRVAMGKGTGTFIGTVNGLQPDRLYFYRAYAINGGGVGYGSVNSFRTPMVTAKPLYPIGNAVVSCCSLTFDWMNVPGATYYELQISRNLEFKNPIHVGNCAGSTTLVTGFTNWLYTGINQSCVNLGNISNAGVWFWRVRAYSQSNSSDWSEPGTFSYVR